MRRAPLLLLLLALVAGSASAVIDPFYRNRMEAGVRAFEQGNWEVAARQLRIACFGHLDEPVVLAAGLVRLAIVETRRGDEDAFRRIFSRLNELEERFAAYSAAPLTPELRRQFGDLAARLVSVDILRATSGFATIAERADAQRLAGLPAPQRRAELEARVRAEPERPEWRLEMARLELTARQGQAALGWLDSLPPEVATVPPAICLRQQAATETGRCEGMDLTGPFCQDVPPAVVEFRLQCLVDAGSWAEAASLIGSLDSELRARRRVTRLERRVRKNFDGELPGGESAAEAPTVALRPTPPPAATTAPSAAAATPVVPAPAPAGLEEVERLRGRLASATTIEQLAVLLAEAETLVDDRPALRQAHLLAGEIAYLKSDWQAAVRHFRQVGPLGPDEARLAFYQAVALYESGEPAAAAEVLRPVASRLERNSFVTAYVDRILTPGG